MTIFNSLGSNYDLATALRTLVSFGNDATRETLIQYLSARYGGSVVLTYKGRDALRLALAALPRKGKVAVNGYTCLAVYEAITQSGHTPLYLDVAEGALDFSPHALAAALEKDHAIVAVIVQNTLGSPVDIASIERLCKEHQLPLIEDLAHSIGMHYEDGREAGTVGDFAALSFSQDKLVDAVSGGALIVRNDTYRTAITVPSTNLPLSQQLKDRFYPILTWNVRMLYPLGLGKALHWLLKKFHLLSRPFDGSGRAPRMLPSWYCAVILREFYALGTTQAHRARIAHIYAAALSQWQPKPFSLSSPIRFPLIVPDRTTFIAHLRTHEVHVSDIWYDAPVAPQKYLHRTNYAGECPNAEKVSAGMLNLPLHRNVSGQQATHIAQTALAYLRNTGAAYHVARIERENEWESFIARTRPHSFLQSWTWGQVHKDEGKVIFRIGAYRDDVLVGIALFIKHDARRGAFLLCPHGPLITSGEDRNSVLKVLADEAARLAQREHCAFVRVCPLDLDTEDARRTYGSLGFRDAPIHMHPELAWMLDVTRSEDELMKDMRKTTRYLVRQMEKKGVEISQSTNPADIDMFWQVYQSTVERQQFTPFSKAHLRNEFERFAKDGQAVFFFGRYEGQLIAAAIIIFYAGQAFYHHSGSIHQFRDVNASYLLQWRVIQEAKRRGCTHYNFWGISPENRPKHPWAGLSLFKKGFGGYAEAYVHAQDKPLTKKYWINWVVETVRRVKRGL